VPLTTALRVERRAESEPGQLRDGDDVLRGQADGFAIALTSLVTALAMTGFRAGSTCRRRRFFRYSGARRTSYLRLRDLTR
jgi:hypothetical protein